MGEVAAYTYSQSVIPVREEIVRYDIWADLQAIIREIKDLLDKKSSIDTNVIFHLPLFMMCCGVAGAI
jgi:hypothetical protein